MLTFIAPSLRTRRYSGLPLLVAQGVDLFLQRLEFAQLALQEAGGERGLFGDALRRQQIGVAQLVVGGAEIPHLDVALLDQCGHAEIHRAEADAGFAGDVALGELGIVLQQPQHAIAHVLALGPDPVVRHQETEACRKAKATAAEVASNDRPQGMSRQVWRQNDMSVHA